MVSQEKGKGEMSYSQTTPLLPPPPSRSYTMLVADRTAARSIMVYKHDEDKVSDCLGS